MYNTVVKLNKVSHISMLFSKQCSIPLYFCPSCLSRASHLATTAASTHFYKTGLSSIYHLLTQELTTHSHRVLLTGLYTEKYLYLFYSRPPRRHERPRPRAEPPRRWLSWPPCCRGAAALLVLLRPPTSDKVNHDRQPQHYRWLAGRSLARAYCIVTHAG